MIHRTQNDGMKKKYFGKEVEHHTIEAVAAAYVYRHVAQRQHLCHVTLDRCQIAVRSL